MSFHIVFCGAGRLRCRELSTKYWDQWSGGGLGQDYRARPVGAEKVRTEGHVWPLVSQASSIAKQPRIAEQISCLLTWSPAWSFEQPQIIISLGGRHGWLGGKGEGGRHQDFLLFLTSVLQKHLIKAGLQNKLWTTFSPSVILPGFWRKQILVKGNRWIVIPLIYAAAACFIARNKKQFHFSTTSSLCRCAADYDDASLWMFIVYNIPKSYVVYQYDNEPQNFISSPQLWTHLFRQPLRP